MRRLDEGETFVVTRNGVPVGELTPLRRQRFVDAHIAAAIVHDRTARRLPAFRADVDAATSQDAQPRG